ncbi:STAS domain-containing protein [Spirillospora sp. NPDC127200]
MATLQVSTYSRDDASVMCLAGTLSADTADDARRRVRAALRDTGSHLVLDLSRVTHADPEGLRVLKKVRKTIAARHGWLALAGLRPDIARAVHTADPRHHFAAYSSPDAALATLRIQRTMP